MAGPLEYSTFNRRRYIKLNEKKYKLGLKGQWSIRRIAMDVAEYFDRKPPANATIQRDLNTIKEEFAAIQGSYSEEAERLLLPENFAEWRSAMFRAPGNKDYLTPKHQEAWFHLIRTLALKEVPPEWVIDYLELDKYLEDIDLTEWIRNPDQLLSLFLLAPPRHGKSDLAAHVIIWLICRNPDIRIIWCAGKLGISELTVKFVKNELESNEKLIELYGPFENDSDWSNVQFTVATRKTRMRSPTLIAVGKGSTILSLDADFIFGDDMFDLKSSLSPAQVQKDINWFTSQLLTRREPWTPFLGIGSHQPSPTGDAYQYMDEEHDNEIHFVKQAAHDYGKCKPLEGGMAPADQHGDWCLLWNQLRNWAYLEQMRRSLGDISFEVCYNQDSQQSLVDYFRQEVVRGNYPQPEVDPETGKYRDFNHYEQSAGILDRRRSFGVLVPSCCSRRELRTSIGFDPAAGQRRGTSESALVVLQGCFVCRRRYFVDYWHKRQSPERHPDTIGQYAAQYRPDRVRIEINAYQKALARDPRLKALAAELRFIIDESFTGQDKVDPALGVPLLSRHMEQGKFSVPYQLPQDQQLAEDLLRQAIRYPAEPTDIIMALWLADQSLNKMFDEMLFTQPSYYGDPLPYIRDQQHTLDLGEWDKMLLNSS